jgi:hypothetical protein
VGLGIEGLYKNTELQIYLLASRSSTSSPTLRKIIVPEIYVPHSPATELENPENGNSHSISSVLTELTQPKTSVSNLGSANREFEM